MNGRRGPSHHRKHTQAVGRAAWRAPTGELYRNAAEELDRRDLELYRGSVAVALYQVGIELYRDSTEKLYERSLVVWNGFRKSDDWNRDVFDRRFGRDFFPIPHFWRVCVRIQI